MITRFIFNSYSDIYGVNSILFIKLVNLSSTNIKYFINISQRTLENNLTKILQ